MFWLIDGSTTLQALSSAETFISTDDNNHHNDGINTYYSLSNGLYPTTYYFWSFKYILIPTDPPQKEKRHKKDHLSTHTGNQKYCEWVFPKFGPITRW